jgi:hypothetical protein
MGSKNKMEEEKPASQGSLLFYSLANLFGAIKSKAFRSGKDVCHSCREQHFNRKISS